MQALVRSQPAFPMITGKPEKRTHDYARQGTTTLFAAINLEDRTVIASTHRRHPAVKLKNFLTMTNQKVPADLDTHFVCDNYGMHKSSSVTAWLEQHPRLQPCTSHQHTRLGPNRLRGFSPRPLANSFSAPTTAPSKPRRKTCAAESPPGTKTRCHSSGPRPPMNSSPASPNF